MGKHLEIPRSAQYHLLENLGHHDNVFKALDKRTGAPCVIKFPRAMHPLLREERRDYDLLEYEAAKLTKWREIPNVVQLFDQHLEDDPPFLVLEKLGKTLTETIPDNGMDFTQILQSLRPITVALDMIHSIGDTHFDVHPDNILQVENGFSWKLIDPCPADFYQSEVTSKTVPNNWERDILALGRTFLYAYRGAWADKVLLEEERPLESWEYHRFEDVLDRMLWTGAPTSRKRRPSAMLVRRTIDEILQHLGL